MTDALLLLAHEKFSSSYYLAGYSVGFGLKACVARQIRKEEIPDKSLVNRVFTHDFRALVGLAGLAHDLADAQNADNQFQAYWGIAAEWSPESRYGMVDAMSAQLLMTAITDPNHGVLKWIRTHW